MFKLFYKLLRKTPVMLQIGICVFLFFILTTGVCFHYGENMMITQAVGRVFDISRPNSWKHIDYHIVVDAGSTGSRLYMYFIKQGAVDYFRLANGTVISHKVYPGLSDYADNPIEAVDQMATLINWLNEVVDSKTLARTTLSILATAGMRLLPLEKQSQVIDVLWAHLPKYVVPRIVEIKVIPGWLEGVHQWIAANYLMNTIPGRFSTSTPLTKGIVELGGASLQFAYEMKLPRDSVHPDAHIVSVCGAQIGSRTSKYKIVSTSLLDYGVNSMFTWFLSDNNTYSSLEEKESCLPLDCRIEVIGDRSLRGSGFLKKCMSSLESAAAASGRLIRDHQNGLLYFSTDFNNATKLLFEPPPQMPFYGYSEFFYGAYQLIKFNKTFDPVNTISYYRRADVTFSFHNRLFVNHTHKQKYCRTKCSKIHMMMESGSFFTEDTNYIVRQCFKSAYLLLINKILSRSGNYVTPQAYYLNREVQWTFGAAVEFASTHQAPKN